MQRPIMNPTFLDEAPAARLRRPALHRRLLRAVGRFFLAIFRILLSNPFALDHSALRVDVGTPTGRFLRGFFYRLVFVPVLAAIVAGLLVYAGTHPSVQPIENDPITVGVYYDPVNFAGHDNTRLEAWLVPVIDARKVVEERDKVLRQKSPAVVLVHDYGQSREQMLPLVRPLHEAGYVVLVTALRGDDRASSLGQTFGLNETHDVTAAVEMLRRRPFVDAGRIAVVGIGTGATASVLVAEDDPAISAVVALRPPDDADSILYRYLVPKKLNWMGPLCRWTFEMSYGVSADDLNIASLLHGSQADTRMLVLRNVGVVNDSTMTEAVVEHLYQKLQKNDVANVQE